MPAEPDQGRIEALSARMLRVLPSGAWHEAFVAGKAATVRFEECTLTLLHARPATPVAAAGADRLQREMRWLAASHQGRLDPAAAPDFLALFKRPHTALRMALALQATEDDMQFKVGLHTAPCTLALFQAGGRRWAVADVAAADEARVVAGKAVDGTVVVAGTTCRALGPALDQEVGGALVSEEYQGEELIQATVILPPRATAFQSSFAGLGLT